MGEWWESYFDEAWLKGGFGIIRRKRTLADTRFILKALSLEPNSRILDACCGVGVMGSSWLVSSMWTSLGYFEKEADNLRALRAIKGSLSREEHGKNSDLGTSDDGGSCQTAGAST